jgi:N-acetylmuramoyl-L-alanine amidase
MDEPGALWLPNNNYFPARNGYTPRYVILHGTAGYTRPEAVAAFFKATEKGNDPVSTHYIIGLSGELVQCIAEQHVLYIRGCCLSVRQIRHLQSALISLSFNLASAMPDVAI